ncbi:unnamed protein product [Dibothriocephalus latus]|uniref:Uncharacterized protein n=1 Tax=Dibothriocephalus latus TaxID=60516 RepID=A0A3P7N6Z2_DIBLA|nr:unnamed protein product [Dibothriocephalus latus]
MGDRNVLYKYVNSNLLAVMTLGESALEKVDIVSLYLIDVVVGKVIHSAVHRRCNHPVSLLVSENWVLVSASLFVEIELVITTATVVWFCHTKWQRKCVRYQENSDFGKILPNTLKYTKLNK